MALLIRGVRVATRSIGLRPLENESALLSRRYSASAPGAYKVVGFIGLGNMGKYMALNLLKNKCPVVAFDLSKSTLLELEQAGASIANSAAEVASRVSQLVTMLPSSPQVSQVYTGSAGILGTVQPGTLLIDSSTIDPSVSKHIAALATAKDAVFMDAPVSGGVNAARDANLTFMVGGPSSQFDAAKTLLSLMGKNIVYCGEVGSGQAVKICNNMLLGISMIGVSETMNLGKRLGLDPKLLAKVINTSSGRCWSSELYNPCPGVLDSVPASNGYKGGFGTALMAKDLGLAQAAATATQSPTPLGSLAHQLYRVMCAQGYGGLDFSAAFKFLQEEQQPNQQQQQQKTS